MWFKMNINHLITSLIHQLLSQHVSRHIHGSVKPVPRHHPQNLLAGGDEVLWEGIAGRNCGKELGVLQRGGDLCREEFYSLFGFSWFFTFVFN
jgi:hypothetical protein